jgi:hypothetical protein
MCVEFFENIHKRYFYYCMPVNFRIPFPTCHSIHPQKLYRLNLSWVAVLKFLSLLKWAMHPQSQSFHAKQHIIVNTVLNRIRSIQISWLFMIDQIHKGYQCNSTSRWGILQVFHTLELTFFPITIKIKKDNNYLYYRLCDRDFMIEYHLMNSV